MKTLFLVGGTMGIGKTTVCNRLKIKLENSAFLDGDWCWDMNPFTVTDETKKMVMDNISYLLNSFLNCSVIENVVFCWVMHEQAIIDDILSRLDLTDCRVKNISLICDENVLIERLSGDIKEGIREVDVIERSVKRISMYDSIDSVKINVTKKTVEETAMEILEIT